MDSRLAIFRKKISNLIEKNNSKRIKKDLNRILDIDLTFKNLDDILRGYISPSSFISDINENITNKKLDNLEIVSDLISKYGYNVPEEKLPILKLSNASPVNKEIKKISELIYLIESQNGYLNISYNRADRYCTWRDYVASLFVGCLHLCRKRCIGDSCRNKAFHRGISYNKLSLDISMMYNKNFAPGYQTSNKKILINSIGEIRSLPKDAIKRIINVCKKSPHNKFIFLSHYPEIFKKFNEFSCEPNFTVIGSINEFDSQDRINRTIEELKYFKNPLLYVSPIKKEVKIDKPEKFKKIIFDIDYQNNNLGPKLNSDGLEFNINVESFINNIASVMKYKNITNVVLGQKVTKFVCENRLLTEKIFDKRLKNRYISMIECLKNNIGEIKDNKRYISSTINKNYNKRRK